MMVSGLAARRLAIAVNLTFVSVFGGALIGCHNSGAPKPTQAAAPSPIPSTAIEQSNVHFVDVAEQSGLKYQWVITGKRPANILETIGNGCAFLDYNGDGNLDILLVGPKPALFKGDGRGHFTDVTHETGLDKLSGDFRGCAVGDYDNDGYPDIYLSAYRGGALLHNDHGAHFTNVSVGSGLKTQPWGTSCGFVDIDNDGKLDLYVGNYVDFGPNTVPQLCSEAGSMTTCGPRYYRPVKGVLYRNLGGGRFSDVTTQWGADKTSGKVLGVAFADFDGSGRQNIALANDEVACNLMKNDGRHFLDTGAVSGTAFGASGGVVGGMGVDWGDYDNDGQLDLAVATFQHEAKCVYHNDGHDLFTEQSAALGIADATSPYVAFGAKWLDADNDGYLDLMITNGHVQDNVEQIDKSTTYRQATEFFHNEHGTRFTDASTALAGAADRPIVGRGLAVGDYDNDGRIDALIVDSEGTPILLHNETPSTGHYLLINLTGVKSNRDGQGALITVTAGSAKLLRQCTTAGSYLSASDKRVHFGLGQTTMVDSVSVRWPSGHVDVYKDVKADRLLNMREGDPIVR